MELALYAPGLGYYSAGAVKIGAAGDFVTAPEVSDLFSRCMALQCAQVLGETGGDILELGAGTGRMAAGILAELHQQGQLPQRYLIVEVSADLAARQRQRIAHLPAILRERVSWLTQLPVAFTGVVLANEVADALPCRRVRLRAGQWQELGVSSVAAATAAGVAPDGSAGFIECARAADAQLRESCEALEHELPQPLPDDYETELCPRLTPWIAALCGALARGAILVCDYGLPRRHYYHPQRVRGTLVCHYRQRVHTDPYINPGVQDITAWVDFTRVAEAGDAAGMAVAGFVTQAAFLLGVGLPRLMEQLTDTVRRLQLAGEARRLLMPGEMGEAFKVMALTRGFDTPLLGTTQQDLRHLL
ncbi:MAG: SAM-dependent methyltransferase [Proteobacteria bacterium]|nr:SAM-dependent methyltransferase [Pseudomonadota bacterium]